MNPSPWDIERPRKAREGATRLLARFPQMTAEQDSSMTTAPQTHGTIADYLREAQARGVVAAGYQVLGLEPFPADAPARESPPFARATC